MTTLLEPATPRTRRGVKTHKPHCQCGMCSAIQRAFSGGGYVSRHAAPRTCDTCNLELSELAFPKVDGGRGTTCRNCRPHGAALDVIPVEVVV